MVYHPKCLIDAFGVLFPEKLIKAYVVPVFTPTKEFPSPVFSGFPVPAFLNKLSFRMTNALIGTVKSPVNAFCSKQGLPSKFKFLDTPILYGISPNFLPKPLDYPSHHHFTGFWFDDTSSSELPVDITSFFETSKKKLIITFGSMPYKSKIDINEFISALVSELDVGVAIVRGWGLKDASIIERDNVLVIDHAPFDRLFPLADGVVHHGGAGTESDRTSNRSSHDDLSCLVPFWRSDVLGQESLGSRTWCSPYSVVQTDSDPIRSHRKNFAGRKLLTIFSGYAKSDCRRRRANRSS